MHFIVIGKKTETSFTIRNKLTKFLTKKITYWVYLTSTA